MLYRRAKINGNITHKDPESTNNTVIHILCRELNLISYITFLSRKNLKSLVLKIEKSTNNSMKIIGTNGATS